MKKIMVVLCFVSLFLKSPAALAQVPQLINYQGRLLTGTNLVNGNVGLSLRLFDVSSGGSAIYEDSNSVTVADGLYSTFIGDNPVDASFLTALANTGVYVEVVVNGVTLSPRERLASVAYSQATRGISVDANNSVVVNPAQNSIHPASYPSTIGGGLNNSIQYFSYSSFIGGGEGNSIFPNNYRTVLGGGYYNSIQNSAANSVLGGGYYNSIQEGAASSFLGGGNGNSIQTNAVFSVLGGGIDNSIGEISGASVLGGGIGNHIQVNAGVSFLGSGMSNNIELYASFSVLGGGEFNSIKENSYDSVLVGGNGNSIFPDANSSFLGGGIQNIIYSAASLSVLGGGQANFILAGASVLCGGIANEINGAAYYSFLGGGRDNTIGNNSPYSVIPGGYHNGVGSDAENAFAAGYRAKANHSGTFVWADKQEADFTSTANNQFLIRAAGGVGIGVANPASALHVKSSTGQAEISIESGDVGAHRWTLQSSGLGYSPSVDSSFQIIDRSLVVSRLLITTNGNVGIGTSTPATALDVAGTITCIALNQTSDRDAKENFAAVDPDDVLEKIAAMPVTRWNFKADPTVQHVGPMAQDFHEAFGLGTDEKHIATVDESGVALAAIQALNSEVGELRAENAGLKSELDSLKSRLDALALTR